jgi:hypothetical protein
VKATPLEDGLADLEVGAAAAVNPEAATVDAPGAALNAGGAAYLSGEADVTVGTDIAPVSVAVIGGAGDDARGSSSSVLWRGRTSGGDDKLSAASTVDPESAAVGAPGAALDASRTADLAHEADVAAGADVAPVSVAVIGGARDARRGTIARLCRCRCGGDTSGYDEGYSYDEKFTCARHLASFDGWIVRALEVITFRDEDIPTLNACRGWMR